MNQPQDQMNVSGLIDDNWGRDMHKTLRVEGADQGYIVRYMVARTDKEGGFRVIERTMVVTNVPQLMAFIADYFAPTEEAVLNKQKGDKD